jgi:predicted PurR-regulated permease PerM
MLMTVTDGVASGASVVDNRRAPHPRGLLIMIGIAAVLVAALGLRAFAGVVAPVFLAVVLAITVQPLRRLPARRGLPNWVGALLSLVAVYAIVIGLIVVLVVSGAQLATLLEEYAPQFEAFLGRVGDSLAAAGVGASQLDSLSAALDPGKLVGVIAGLLGGLAGILGSITFLILLLFFTVTDAGVFAGNLARISPAGRRLAEALVLLVGRAPDFTEGRRVERGNRTLGETLVVSQVCQIVPQAHGPVVSPCHALRLPMMCREDEPEPQRQ